MGYRDIYKESNEQAEERFSLVMERIAEIAEETDVPEKFDDYFKKTAAFLLQLKNVSEKAEKDTLKDASLTECEKQNAGFYDDIKAENYGKSYGNPTYAVEKLGEEYPAGCRWKPATVPSDTTGGLSACVASHGLSPS